MGTKEKGYCVDILRLKTVALQQLFSSFFELTSIYTRNEKMGLLMSTSTPAQRSSNCAGVLFSYIYM